MGNEIKHFASLHTFFQNKQYLNKTFTQYPILDKSLHNFFACPGKLPSLLFYHKRDGNFLKVIADPGPKQPGKREKQK
jgi:hypothetical protein